MRSNLIQRLFGAWADDLWKLFLLLSFMTLARVKSVESLRYCAPGEWGKVLGLDRVPEVRTLRQKIGASSQALCGTRENLSSSQCGLLDQRHGWTAFLLCVKRHKLRLDQRAGK